MKDADLDALECIRRTPGLYAGQFPDDVIKRLSNAGFVERYWDNAFLAKVRLTPTPYGRMKRNG